MINGKIEYQGIFFFWEKNEDKLKEGENEKESGRQ